jgi:truncated hemoglobin YjbI
MKVIQKVKTFYAQRLCRSTAAYPAYRPDLAPSDFHLLSTLKEFLGGRCFKRDEEVKDVAKERLNELVAEVYDEGI